MQTPWKTRGIMIQPMGKNILTLLIMILLLLYLSSTYNTL